MDGRVWRGAGAGAVQPGLLDGHAECMREAAGHGTWQGFAAGDGVTVSARRGAAQRETVRRRWGRTGWFPGTVAVSTEQEEPVTIYRYVPEMDFVVQSGKPAMGLQVRHGGRRDGEMKFTPVSWGFQKLEMLSGTVHRQLRARPRLGLACLPGR